ncbi:uncharacterized protein LOC107473021 [Arachis duranensis]|uniref:Uncharacterized protein LOC107473021 n=1 Tax=Arachis duranensis TaxID=130453 RepID=A0A6P5N7W3_ARADU|nr:uncharacterized protein LOC107473021 [Arachis duranensis]
MARVHCNNLLGFHCVGIEEAVGHRGGIWFLSSIANSSCVVIDQIDQCITVKVSVGHNKPWMAVGDFNEIVAPDESTGAYFSSHRASLLATTLDDCELFDLKVTGRRYTWYRAVQASRDLAKSPRVKGSRPFRFQAAWATHPSYKHVISKAWNQEFGGVTERLKMVQQASLDFNSKIFGNIFVRKNKLEYQIDQIQRRLEVTDVLSLRIKEAELREDYNRLLLQEELFWYQKSRDQWVKNHNRVHGLYVRDGSWSTDPDVLQEESLSFYKNLFGTTEEVEVDCLGDVPMPTLSTEACAKLIDLISFAEVKSAVFSMSPFKAPGPDGFQAYFFKEYWEIVGTEIWNIVRSAFLGEFLNPSIMETLIVLIPKIDNPTFMKDFRPISLCNVVYKIITKVLTNRLRPFLPDIVSPLQEGFIPGRGAPDNIIVAQEILNFMKHTKSKKGWIGGFWESTLIAFGFPIITVNLIMTCVRASSLSIMWNGNRLDSFAPRRGLRQGDPMSPYLFVLCLERLACYISHKVVEGVWKPVSVTRGSPKFSHLMFADDLLLFCQATKSQIKSKSLSLPSFCLHWVSPPVHSVKLNCDASWFAPSGYAGFGCIIRNPDGCWLKGCTGKVEVCSVLFAELYAIWRGLLLAWESGFREVICETDCLEALFLVNQRMLSKDIPEWDLAKHIQEVMNWNWRVSILLIQRTANSVADCMAKAAASVADIHSNWSQPWSELQHLIDLDMTLAN